MGDPPRYRSHFLPHAHPRRRAGGSARRNRRSVRDARAGAAPAGLHGGIWSLLLNAAVAIAVSAFARAPSADAVRRVHGELERFGYGSADEAMGSDLAEVAS